MGTNIFQRFIEVPDSVGQSDNKGVERYSHYFASSRGLCVKNVKLIAEGLKKAATNNFVAKSLGIEILQSG
jgi:hypothetical protein